jgi:hypothetical protein
MSPRVPGSQPSFTREQALLVAEAAGLDLDRPLRGQLDSDDGASDSLAQQISALSAKVDALADSARGQGAPAPEETFAKGLAGKLAEAQSPWFTPGGDDAA